MRNRATRLVRAGWYNRSLTLNTTNQSSVFANALNQKRYLNIHEYQSQELLAADGILVPKGRIATTADEAYYAAQELESQGVTDVVVKAQVLTGGRGLGHFDSGLKGGVHISQSAAEVKEYARKMLGYKLFTKQTGAEGKPCDKVYIAERLFVRRETYLAILMDRQSIGPVIVGSSRGGTNIEQISEEYPDAIFKVPVSIKDGIQDSQLEEISEKLGFKEPKHKAQAKQIVEKLYNLFIRYDCTLAEINPLIEDHQHRIVAMDAKLNFDDNADFRQKKVFALRDKSQEDPTEVHASDFGLNYIKLEGSIGCLVNGAGLAMATMDIIQQRGGKPANFLDIGGGATGEQVTEAFKILSSDKNVKAILVNIFGGIMRCDIIAYGIINAAQNLGLRIPLVVRLSGTKVDEAKTILENSGLRVITAEDLDEAAQKVVKVAQIVTMADAANLKVSFELPL
eukprot:TRINITY_DN1144_c0_g1_i1.p1 TRINITY_DN1144_c0_g1~~TRINITY_DN1144_c0_g1_i1.p1  ORF type:complete len:454 (-),score=106.45 TRINITY_DN1144_c0_g1_i1:50-1411(-)